MQPGAPLAEQYGTPKAPSHHQRDEQQCRARHEQRRHRQCQIDPTFASAYTIFAHTCTGTSAITG